LDSQWSNFIIVKFSKLKPTLVNGPTSRLWSISATPCYRNIFPQSASFKLVAHLIRELKNCCCDLFRRIVIVNAPAHLEDPLAILESYIGGRTMSKVVVVRTRDEICKIIDPSMVPAQYGGKLRLESERVVLGGVEWKVDPETCTLAPKHVTDADYTVPRLFAHKAVVEHIAARNLLEIRRHVTRAGTRLIWQFMTNSEVQFTVVQLKGQDKVRLIPSWTVITPKLPEEGSVICKEPGEYVLEFFNAQSGWNHQVKLEYKVEMESPQ